MPSHSRAYLCGFLIMLAVTACSIKEKRMDCPCYLDVKLMAQESIESTEDMAWCSIWSEQTCLYSAQMPWPASVESVAECKVHPRGRVDVVVSTHMANEGKVMADNGREMPELYATSCEVDCSSETASLDITRLDKKHCRLSLRLSEEALHRKEEISVTVSAPYNGVTFPAMCPSRGEFMVTTGFGDEGNVEILLPPQGGTGLKIVTLLKGKPSSSFDLYAIMKEQLYDWENRNLADFCCELSLNGISNGFVISDWDIKDIDEKTY